jgi:hypothetical protein
MCSPFSLLILLTAPAIYGEPIVTVYIPPVFDELVDQAFRTARLVVNETYAEIGIRVVWRSTRTFHSGCSRRPLETRIVVALLSTAPDGITSQALAFSEPYANQGPCVNLVMDRIRPAIANNPRSTGLLLGNALAHEIGHILQGITRHSDTGMMKARWSPEDIRSLLNGHLHFTAYDAEMILQTLAPPAVMGRDGDEKPAAACRQALGNDTETRSVARETDPQ